MQRIMPFITAYITFAITLIVIAVQITKSNINSLKKTILLSIPYFVNYTLLLYCYRMITWTIESNKIHQYPYKYPFCIFVLICCIITFLIMGIYYIINQKKQYGIEQSLLLFIYIHVIAIILIILLRVPMFLGLTGIY